MCPAATPVAASLHQDMFFGYSVFMDIPYLDYEYIMYLLFCFCSSMNLKIFLPLFAHFRLNGKFKLYTLKRYIRYYFVLLSHLYSVLLRLDLMLAFTKHCTLCFVRLPLLK